MHPQAGEQRHLFQLNFWIKRKINWEQCWDQVHSRLVYLPVLSGIFHWCGAVSHAGALVVCQGMLAVDSWSLCSNKSHWNSLLKRTL